MMKIGAAEVCFMELLHTPFLMTIGEEGFFDVDDWLLCLHFNIEYGPLVLVEREEYDEDMVLMRIVYQRPRFCYVGIFYRITLRYYKVQWVGERVTPIQPSKTHSLRSTTILQHSMRFQLKGRLPTILGPRG